MYPTPQQQAAQALHAQKQAQIARMQQQQTQGHHSPMMNPAQAIQAHNSPQQQFSYQSNTQQHPLQHPPSHHSPMHQAANLHAAAAQRPHSATPLSTQAPAPAAAASSTATGAAGQPPQPPGLPSAAAQHGHSFRTAFEQFFHGFDAFLTATESQQGAAATSDEALNKLYQRYMQLEMETDKLSLYLNQTEMKLRLEIEEPQITLEQLQQQQAQYAATHPRQPPLPPTLALFRAQYEMHAHPKGSSDVAQRTLHAGGAFTSPRPTPGSSSGVTTSTPRTPASSQQLLTPTPGQQTLTPNHPTVPSPSPAGSVLTPNSTIGLAGDGGSQSAEML